MTGAPAPLVRRGESSPAAHYRRRKSARCTPATCSWVDANHRVPDAHTEFVPVDQRLGVKKGWDFLLDQVLPSLRGRSLLGDQLVERVDAAGKECMHDVLSSAQSSPRVRARARRRRAKILLAAGGTVAAGWLRSGGAGGKVDAGAVFPDDMLGAFGAASRTSPFACAGDVRGRSRDLLESVIHGDSVGPLRFRAAAEAYESAAQGCGSSSMPFVASRLGLPEKAAIVPLRPWLSPATAAAWLSPAAADDEVPKAYFAAGQREWRIAVRKMARSGLVLPLGANSSTVGLAAGAFCVKKDDDKDRLIGDRRPRNAQEQMPGPVRLPYAPRMRKVRLAKGQALWFGKRDLSNCFYLFRVDDDRLHRQVIGPRVPRSWLADLDNESADRDLHFENWCASDLRVEAGEDGEWLDDDFCQIAMTGVMMGDIGAVTVIQEAHTRMLLAHGVLEPTELVGGAPEVFSGDFMGDVYIDDLVLLMIGEMLVPPDGLVSRLAAADIAYAKEGLPVKVEKGAGASTRGHFWGASLARRGTCIGFDAERRASLAAATLLALQRGVSGQNLLRLLGTWVFALSFRREAMAILGSCFVLARSLPRRSCVRVDGPVFDELLSLCFLWPLFEADLTCQPLSAGQSCLVLATDAEGEGGLGGCVARVSEDEWSRLYILAEEQGEHFALEQTLPADERGDAKLTDRRNAAAALAVSVRWSVCLRRAAAGCPRRANGELPHINILEARAVRMLVEQLAADGVTHARIVCLCDSRVVVGAFSKGRSSSRQLNFELRKTAACCLLYGLTLDLVWVPTWGNPADAPSRGARLSAWRRQLPNLPLRLPRPAVAPRARDAWERLLAPSANFAGAQSLLPQLFDESVAPASGSGEQAGCPSGKVRASRDSGERELAGCLRAAQMRRDRRRDWTMNSESDALARGPGEQAGRPPGKVRAPHEEEGEQAGCPRATRFGENHLEHEEEEVANSISAEELPRNRRERRRATRQERRILAHAARCSARRRSRCFQKRGSFLEVFAGHGKLSACARRLGVWTLDGFDLDLGPRLDDLCTTEGFNALVRLILRLRPRYVHFACPCRSFSQALRGEARTRSRQNPLGDESRRAVREGNRLAVVTARLCKLLARLGCFWSVENPRGSYLWLHPAMVDLAKQGFQVKYDNCAYGAVIPGEGPYMKPTTLLTNAPWLRALERSCACAGKHVQLQGQTCIGGRWRSRTGFAAGYPTQLAWRWAKCMQDALRPVHSKPLTSWKRLFLMLCGDIHPHPGPQRCRPSLVKREDLLTADVMPITAKRYSDAVQKFEDWLALRGRGITSLLMEEGTDALLSDLVTYIREGFREHTLTSSGVNYCVAGVRRYLLLAAALGAHLGDIRSAMAPVWRVVRSWHLALPPEFRMPVPSHIAVALATWAAACDQWPLALITLLGHHALLRPEEARCLRVSDIVIFEAGECERFPGIFGVLKLTKPKTRRSTAHSAQQHVLLECRHLARWLGWILRPLRGGGDDRVIWRGGAAEHIRLWRRGMSALGVGDIPWTPAGLRGGGATEFFLRTRDVLSLRRRGRWSQLATLDRYLQEAVVLLYARTEGWVDLQPIVDCGVAIFQPHFSTPPPPLLPQLRYTRER